MTALHLAAKFGHTNVLMVLEDKVPWTNVSTKVDQLTFMHAVVNSVSQCISFYVVFQWLAVSLP